MITIIIKDYRSMLGINIYNIYAPACLLNSISSFADGIGCDYEHSLSQGQNMRRIRFVLGSYDPCYSKYAEEYFSRINIQTAFHANNGEGNPQTHNDSVLTILPVYKKLIKGIISPMHLHQRKNQGCQICVHVTTMIVEYEGLTLVTIRGASHLVPFNKPSKALALIQSFLSGKNLPIHR
ncbi:unnamed protein product [Coffea canephora]|uniref:DH200=94 genomic scaffold, scaffold_717 n=1 Tax=Coffea canephora TaxID=49390 RepID=A0A068VJG6_COFCA|nr:unnamed protein product [Coffea canephora]